jgi:ubiquitin carboxyl-terminal hydrolase 22/27/51
MDDNKVTVASVADVLRQNAYLLFYSIRSIDTANNNPK